MPASIPAFPVILPFVLVLGSVASGRARIAASLVSAATLQVVATSNANVPVRKTAPANTNLAGGLAPDAKALGGQARFQAVMSSDPDSG